ncbi:MAG: class I SAM-dependent methyltransferase [Oligoflexia bacterium]|nr:class I SAM-dependent methyltransferase [Oligoflexia bacterium]
MKYIAWGISKLLMMYLDQDTEKKITFSYCIDDFSKEEYLRGIPIKKSLSLDEEMKNEYCLVIFAVSSHSLFQIKKKLNKMGLKYKEGYIFYSDLFYETFIEKIVERLNLNLNPAIYSYALSFTLNSQTPMQTTILGTWLFLELFNKVKNIDGSIAEIGAFHGGNALSALLFMNHHQKKPFHIIDSFEGFSAPSHFDPARVKKGDLSIEAPYEEIIDTFKPFSNVKLYKGFVPDIFSELNPEERYSLVFYDCDLYQPALDAYAYFWDKIIPGGYLLIHDYETEQGGFEGVKKATIEFFADKNQEVFSFYENTMAIIHKNH